jgi:hypothetical protein
MMEKRGQSGNEGVGAHCTLDARNSRMNVRGARQTNTKPPPHPLADENGALWTQGLSSSSNMYMQQVSYDPVQSPGVWDAVSLSQGPGYSLYLGEWVNRRHGESKGVVELQLASSMRVGRRDDFLDRGKYSSSHRTDG